MFVIFHFGKAKISPYPQDMISLRPEDVSHFPERKVFPLTSATIFNIQRFSIYDGPGIRTSVFFKGCSLCCLWCHNPESISRAPQLEFAPEKCIGCGRCFSACPKGLHTATEAGHVIDFASCAGCGKCADTCFAEALTLVGQQMTVDEVAEAILTDKPYFEQSNGGVTFTGGECMLYPDFLAAVMERLKPEKLSFAIDTAGNVPWESFEKVLPYTNLFLFDVKAADPALHKKLTGADNLLIQSNLRKLAALGCRIIVRYPFIPPYNSGEAEAIAALLAPLGVELVEIMPYHRLGEGKYAAIGKENRAPEAYIPSDEQLETALSHFTSRGINARRT